MVTQEPCLNEGGDFHGVKDNAAWFFVGRINHPKLSTEDDWSAIMVPHTPGEAYFVGETLVVNWEGIAQYLADLRGVPGKAYKELAPVALWESATGGPRLPAERMPRAAARLFIECTGVEVVPYFDSSLPRWNEPRDYDPAKDEYPDGHVFVSTFRPIEEPASE